MVKLYTVDKIFPHCDSVLGAVLEAINVNEFSGTFSEWQSGAAMGCDSDICPMCGKCKAGREAPHTDTMLGSESTEIGKQGESASNENPMECFTHLQNLFYLFIRETKATRDTG